MILQKLITFPIKSITGKESGDKITLNLKLKDVVTTNNYVIQRAYLTQRLNERQGTANTLTRAEVKGGGRKPWKQKGTGRARAGSNTSPLWKGGGVSFGPKPKLYSNKINRKEWQLSLRSLLVAKEKDITVLENFNLLDYKTNDIIKILQSFNINLFENTLIIVPKIEEKLIKSTKNIKTIKVLVANNLNLKQILLAQNLFITKDSLKTIEETYNG
uniref:Large ribosomal subunit protein uL4c n=1 Tax=Chorda asiatica TaxID=1281577 RepID=A0A8F0FA21_9PHAE|nr:50S ribosomal protein L4 [Chorda asiatica]QWK43142.1 ribosomal protein L4 [Chorda asiatica]WAM62175.1 50S ribosomal protein L4 [Chorda asiatica]